MIGISITIANQCGAGGEIGPAIQLSGTSTDSLGNYARIGTEASMTLAMSDASTITGRKWGSTLGGTQYGTGATPTTLSAGTLYYEATTAAGTFSGSRAIRHAPATAGSLSSAQYSTGIGNADRTISVGFTIPAGVTLTYSLVSAPAGYSIPAGATRRVATGTAADATLTIRGTDQYGRTVDVTEGVDLVTPTLSYSAGLLEATTGADDPDATAHSITITGGDYDGVAVNFTAAQIRAVASGRGLNVLVPNAPSLTTDTGTAGTLDAGDVAVPGRAGLWMYPAGQTAPTITTTLRDAGGQIQAPFTSWTQGTTGTAVTTILTRESDGLTTAASATVPVASAAFSPLSLGSKLRLWLDFTDTTKLFTNTAGTTPVSADDDPINYVHDKSGNGHHFQVDTAVSGATAPKYRSAGYCLFGSNANALLNDMAITGLTSTSSIFFALKKETVTTYMLLGYNGDTGAGIGGASNSGTDTPNYKCGSPTYYKDGVAISPQTQEGHLYSAWGSAPCVASALNVDMTGTLGWGTDEKMILLRYTNASSYCFQGRATHIIFTDGTETPTERTNLIAWMAARLPPA
jgi:hypothetical protein